VREACGSTIIRPVFDSKDTRYENVVDFWRSLLKNPLLPGARFVANSSSFTRLLEDKAHVIASCIVQELDRAPIKITGE